MVIESIEHRYTVIERLVQRDPAVAEFIARRDDGPEMRLARIIGPGAADIYREVDRTRKAGHFTDLAECFFNRGTLFLAFFQPQSRSLSQLLAGERITVSRRLLLLQNVLERLILLAPPPYFAAAALTAEHVHFTTTAQAGLTYDCSDILSMGEYTYGNVARAFAQLCENTFAPELAVGKFHELSEFCDGLRTRTWDGYMALYRAFHALYLEFRAVDDDEFLPDNMQTRIHRATAHALSYKRLAICSIILIAVLAYLAWSIWHALQPDGHSPYFTQIGTLVFDDQAEGDPALGDGVEQGATASESDTAGEVSS